MQASWCTHTHVHVRTHPTKVSSYSFIHTLYTPSAHPCIPLLGPLVPMAMCGQRCLDGWGGGGQQGGTLSLFLVAPGPMYTRAHTTQFTNLAKLLINLACLPVNLQASITAFPFFRLLLPLSPSFLSTCLTRWFHSELNFVLKSSLDLLFVEVMCGSLTCYHARDGGGGVSCLGRGGNVRWVAWQSGAHHVTPWKHTKTNGDGRASCCLNLKQLWDRGSNHLESIMACTFLCQYKIWKRKWKRFQMFLLWTRWMRWIPALPEIIDWLLNCP